jgi:hypothetical protein
MIRKFAFDEILEAVDGLTPEEQADLVHLMQRRLAHLGRQRVVAEVKEAQQDANAGRVTRYSPADFLTEQDG